MNTRSKNGVHNRINPFAAKSDYFRGWGDGIITPFRVLPLRVWAAWRMEQWKDLDDKNVRIGFDHATGVVTHNSPHGHRKIGALPTGWDCLALDHRGDGGLFVGPKETIDKLQALVRQRAAADEEIGAIIHHSILDDA